MPSNQSVFKTIRSKHDIEVRVIESMAHRLPTYVSEVERQMGDRGLFDNLRQFFPDLDLSNPVGILTRPEAYAARINLMTTMSDKLPVVLAVCPGTVNQPRKQGHTYEVDYALGISFVVTADDFYTADVISGAYGSAIEACALQSGNFETDFMSIKMWVSTVFDDVPVQQSRLLRVVTVNFIVTVTDYLNIAGGPAYIDPANDHRDRIYAGIASTVTTETTAEDPHA